MRNLILLFALVFGIADAQTDRQAILDYPLTLPRANQLLAALPAMSRYVAGLPDFRERMAKSAKMTPAERLASIENDPKAAAILKENNLSAKDYVVGMPALRMALMLAKGGVGSGTLYASPANLAFAKAKLDQLWPKLAAAEGLPK